MEVEEKARPVVVHPRASETDPLMARKASPMSEPTTNPASPTTPRDAPSTVDVHTSPRAMQAREVDHNSECVGCGAHVSEPCHPTCLFETGQFGPAVILRAAARRLPQHQGQTLRYP